MLHSSLIKKQFGKRGIEIYNLAKAGKTIEEIAKILRMSEVKICEIVNFLWDKGIVSNPLSKTSNEIKSILELNTPRLDDLRTDFVLNIWNIYIDNQKYLETGLNLKNNFIPKNSYLPWAYKKTADFFCIANLKVGSAPSVPYENVLLYYQEAISLSKRKSALLHNNLGYVYGCNGKPEEALAEFNTAILIDKKYWKAAYNKGLILNKRNSKEEYKEAIKCFKQVERLYGVFPDLLHQMASAYKELKDYENAKEMYRKILVSEPDEYYAKTYLEQLGEKIKSSSPVKRKIKINKNSKLDFFTIDPAGKIEGFANLSRAKHLIIKENYLGAIEYYEKALETEALPEGEKEIICARLLDSYVKAEKYEIALKFAKKIFNNMQLCEDFFEDIKLCIGKGNFPIDLEIERKLMEINDVRVHLYQNSDYLSIQNLFDKDENISKFKLIRKKVKTLIRKIRYWDCSKLGRLLSNISSKINNDKKRASIIFYLISCFERRFKTEKFFFICFRSDVFIDLKNYKKAKELLEKARKLAKENKFLERYIDLRYLLISKKTKPFNGLVKDIIVFKKKYISYPDLNRWEIEKYYPVPLCFHDSYSSCFKEYSVIRGISNFLSVEYHDIHFKIFDIPNTSDPYIENFFGLLSYYDGDLRKAIEYYNSALKKSKNPAIWFNRAAAYSKLYNAEKARSELIKIKSIRRIINQTGDLSRIFTNLEVLDKIAQYSPMFVNHFLYEYKEALESANSEMFTKLGDLEKNCEFVKYIRILELAPQIRADYVPENFWDKLETVKKRLLIDFEVTENDVRNASEIFGKNNGISLADFVKNLAKQDNLAAFESLDKKILFHRLRKDKLDSDLHSELGYFSLRYGNELPKKVIPEKELSEKMAKLRAEINTRSPSKYFELVDLAYSIESYELAIQTLDKFLEAFRENEFYKTEKETALLKKGCCFYYLKDYKKAIDSFNECLKHDPKDYLAFHNKALSYFSSEDYKGVIESVNDYIKLNSKSAVAYYFRGFANQKLGKIQEAKKDYKLCLQHNSKFSEAEKELKQMQDEEKRQTELKEESLNQPTAITLSKYKLSQLAGMKEVKDVLTTHILYPIKHKKMAEEYGKKFSGGLILYGPPGCGKSFAIDVIASEAGVKIIKTSVSRILNKWVGNSEKNLSNIFEEARNNQPCIIQFDEIEALGGKRENMDQHWQKVLTNQFLLEMDRIEKDEEQIFVIGSTNQPWDVDQALKRTGRFDNIVFVGPPDAEARIELFKIYTKDLKKLGKINFKELAKLTQGLSCANIKTVCKKVKDLVWKEAVETKSDKKIENEDFVKVIEKECSDIKEWMETAKQYSASGLFKETYKDLVEHLEKENKNSGSKEGSMFG